TSTSPKGIVQITEDTEITLLPKYISGTNSHDSGASVARYAFTARDFHSLLPAGLSRRFGFPARP
ncbi:MAG: hypothetical protein R6V12_15010, partial [Candidatus Hydrogenedentota bacterium]